MKRMTKVLSMLLFVCLVFSSCGQNTSSTTQQSSESKTTDSTPVAESEPTQTSSDDNAANDAGVDNAANDANDLEPITFTIWNSEGAVMPGIQNNEIANEITRLTGVTMEVVQGDMQKFQLLVAGGDLPEIIYTNPAQQGVNSSELIAGGHLLALDDLIEQYGENIKTNFPSRMEYSQKFLSNGENKIYYIPVQCYEGDPDNPDISYTIANVGFMIRWDVYKAIGYPEINTTDDFLDVLKQMQDYGRENDIANGKTVYAITGWSDWGLWPWWLANLRELGYQDLLNGTVMDKTTGKVDMVYNTEAFWDSLKFFNKAYNMGILDPEAFTMKNDQFWEKCQNGQIMLAHASWQTDGINSYFASNGHPDWGFQKPAYDGYPYISGVLSPDYPLGNGQDYANAITNNCKNPERAIQFIDFMNSEEAARLVYSGIQGKHWDIIDGVPSPTEEFLKNSVEDKDYLSYKVGANAYNKLAAHRAISILSDGYPADLTKSNEQKALNQKEMALDYVKHYKEVYGGDYQYPGQVLSDLYDRGEIKTFTDYVLYTSLVQSPSDKSKQILSQVDEYMNVQGVKAIMAKDDAEFESVKAEAFASMEAKGFADCAAEIIGLYEQAEKDASTFSLK